MAQTSITPILVTVEAAAEMLSVSPEIVQRMIDDGTLVSMKVGEQVRLGVAALHAWVDEQMVLSFAGTNSLSDAYGVIEELAREKRGALEPAVDPTSEPVPEGSSIPEKTITAALEDRVDRLGYL